MLVGGLQRLTATRSGQMRSVDVRFGSRADIAAPRSAAEDELHTICSCFCITITEV